MNHTINENMEPNRKPVAVDQPVNINVGTRYRVGNRKVRLDRISDCGQVDLFDTKTMGYLMVRIPGVEGLSPPTLDFMRQAFKDGLLTPLDEPSTPAGRHARNVLLDPDACVAADPKSPWRNGLARRAIDAEVLRTDAACKDFLDDEYGKVPEDLAFRKPSPSALRRWMTRLIKEGRMSALVLKTGRKKGQSPLDPVVDRLVHQAALWYWTRRNGRIADAYALLDDWIKEANAKAPKKPDWLPWQRPHIETLRKRIARLRCYDTVRSKLGERAARKMLQGSGEPMIVDTLLQVVMMDSTTLEQVIVFDKDWALPATKVRIVALMDVRSHGIVGWHVYAGPNRTETSLEAILNAMTPPDVPVEELAEHPGLAWIFGKPLGILPDNELALVGPSVLPGFEELTINLHEPEIEMPTAKASLERFWRTLKGMLAQCPGTLIDPKLAKDLNYDAVGSAAFTLGQLRHIVSQVIAWHNTASSKGLDGQSPLQVWTQLAASRATPAFTDLEHARRVLGRTEEGLLTRDGYERLGIRYRSGEVDALLSNMSGTAALRSQRKDGSWTVRVKVRISPGNLDSVQIFDTLTEEWVKIPSTQPIYTHLLSEWEHREFTRMAKKRNEAFNSQDQRLASRKRTIKQIDKLSPKMAFQQRRNMATLSQSLQVKELSYGQPALPPVTDTTANISPQGAFDTSRRDDGYPISLPTNTSKKDRVPEAPVRADDHGLTKPEENIDFDAISIDIDDGLEPDPEISPEEDAASDDDDDLDDIFSAEDSSDD